MSEVVKHINSSFKEVLVPLLKDNGFEIISGKKAWKHLDGKIYHFIVSGVGANFANVTGFSSCSLTASINVYYPDLAGSSACKKLHKNGSLLPSETECYFRFGLDKNIKQEGFARRDVWWVIEDGSNIEEVILDISKTLIEHALPLVERPHYSRDAQVAKHGS